MKPKPRLQFGVLSSHPKKGTPKKTNPLISKLINSTWEKKLMSHAGNYQQTQCLCPHFNQRIPRRGDCRLFEKQLNKHT